MSDVHQRIEDGEARKTEGMDQTAEGNRVRMRRLQLAFFRDLTTAADRTATIDACTAEAHLRNAYDCGGKWAGSAVRNLPGVIVPITDPEGRWEAQLSSRPSRHRSPVFTWRLPDDRLATAQRRIGQLNDRLAQQPIFPQQRGLFDDL